MEDTQPDQMSVSEWAKVWVLVSLVILGLILLTSTWKKATFEYEREEWKLKERKLEDKIRLLMGLEKIREASIQEQLKLERRQTEFFRRELKESRACEAWFQNEMEEIESYPFEIQPTIPQKPLIEKKGEYEKAGGPSEDAEECSSLEMSEDEVGVRDIEGTKEKDKKSRVLLAWEHWVESTATLSEIELDFTEEMLFDWENE